MDFFYAYQFATEGYSIRRKGWLGHLTTNGNTGAGIYLLWSGSDRPVKFGDGDDADLSYADLNADDWEFIPK